MNFDIGILIIIILIGLTIFLIAFGTKEWIAKGKKVELAPSEQLQLLGITDFNATNTLVYSHIPRVLKMSVVYDDVAQFIYFVSFTPDEERYNGISVESIRSVSHDTKTYKVTIKTDSIDYPLIYLQPNRSEDMEKLISGLDLILGRIDR